MEPRQAETSRPPGAQEAPGHGYGPGAGYGYGYGPVLAEPEFAGPSLLQVLWRGRWLVLGLTLAALAAGYWYLSTATPIYESTSRIYVEKEGPMIISRDEGMIMTSSRNYLYTQAELFKSFPILSAAVQSLDLRRLKTFVKIDNPAGYLKAALLDVEVGKKDEILSVSARSPYPQEAAQIVNAVVDAYITYHARKKQTTAGQVLKILRKEKTTREKDLGDKLQAIVDFKKQAGVLVFQSDQQNLVVKRVAQLWDALSAAQLEAVDAKIAYEALQKVSGHTSLPKELIPPELQSQLFAAQQEYRHTRRQLRQELHLAEEDLRRLREEFTGECPSVRAAKARIERLQVDLTGVDKQRAELEADFLEAALAAAEQRYLAATEKQEKLEKTVDDYSRTASDAIVKQAEFAVLESDMKRAEKLCDILDDRIKEINVTEDTGALNISILDVAKPGASPVEPRKTQTMAIALVVGLMLGAGLAFLKDRLDHRLRSSHEMAALLGAPVLGVLPHMKDSRDLSRSGRRVHLRPKSSTAEAVRTVRTAVYFGAKDEEATTLLVTSPTAGDGKTTVASNLAIAMAQAGQRTLVLDCDLRKPRQHEVFELDRHHSGDLPGLADVVERGASVDKLILATGIEGLDIIPCLARVSNPVEVLNRRKFAALLRALSKRYDRILVDSPPVMPLADARILGALCDATINVLRAEKSTRKVTELTRESLESVGARLLGAVVNDVPKHKGGHGYYGYYGAGKYYRYDRYRYEDDREKRPRRTREDRSEEPVSDRQ